MSNKDYDAYDEDIEVVDNKEHKTKKRPKKHHSENINHHPRRKKRKSSFKAKFCMFLTILFSICCIAITVVFVLAKTGIIEFERKDGTITTNPVAAITDYVMPTLPERTNFLIVGTDADGTRTDTIMVGCYNDELGELTIISIPRDTIVEVDDETYQKMREYYPEPGKKSMKINAIYHYGTSSNDEDDDREFGFDTLQKYIEDNIIGAEIDYRVKVDFEAFRYIIDEIGGIEYNVPQRMYYRCDVSPLNPEGLLIDLQPGLQKLSGEQAEGLIRFRHDYVNGDIGRVEQQQNFMKELVKQLANADVILDNPTAFITAFYKYIETNISITDAGTFIQIFKKFDPEKVVTYTMPGNIGSLYDISGGWVLDEAEVSELCNEVFVKPSSQIIQEREALAAADEVTQANATKFNDKELEIQILNGSYANGVATKAMTELTSLGYNAMSVGEYTEEKTSNTRIFVKEDGMAQTLLDNFPGSEIIVDTNRELTEKYDIVIVIGTGE